MSNLDLKSKMIWLLKSSNILIFENKFLNSVARSFNIERNWGIELSEPFSLVDGSFAVSVVPLQLFKNLFLVVGDSLQLTNSLNFNLGIGNVLLGSKFYGVVIGKRELDILAYTRTEGLNVWFTNYKHLYLLTAKDKLISKIEFISEKVDSNGVIKSKEIFWHNLVCKYNLNGVESYELRGVYDDSRS